MAKVIDSIPKDYWEDRDWVYEHLNDFAAKYPDQWIAVFHKKIVASGENSTKVELAAQEKTGRRENPIIFVERGCHIYEN